MSHTLNDARLVADIDGAQYLRIDWIMRQIGDAKPEYYCATADWPTSPAGKLQARDEEIARLQARVADLEAQLAASPVPPSVAAAATGMSPPRKRSAGAELACPDCGRTFKNAHARDVHRGRSHQSPAAPPEALRAPSEPPNPTPPIALVEDRGDWRCVQCHSDAFARSLVQPDRCFRCAAAPTNGHLAAA